MLIYKKMAECSARIGAIGKLGENKAQNFKFRSIDDVYNGVHDAMAESGIVCMTKTLGAIREKEITNARGNTGYHYVLEFEFTFYAEDGSNLSSRIWGEAIDWGDKAINKCMAIAHKYALIQAFAIPVKELEDPDQQSHEVVRQSSQTVVRQSDRRQPHKNPVSQNPENKTVEKSIIERVNDACLYIEKEFGLSLSAIENRLCYQFDEDSLSEKDLDVLRELVRELKIEKLANAQETAIKYSENDEKSANIDTKPQDSVEVPK